MRFVGGGALMLTRRKFHVVLLGVGAATFAGRANAQSDDMMMVRIRADETVLAIIPPTFQTDLTIEPDQSEDAKKLAELAPSSRAVPPIILIIAGAIALTELAQMITEMLRQVYYGGVLIDTRLQPPSVTSDPRIPAGWVFVIGADGKTTQFTRDQLSLDLLKLIMKVR
jgi:hypothetical protein